MQTSNHDRLSDYPDIYAVSDDGVRLVLDAIPGAVTQERTLNVALLLLYGNHLAGIDSLPSRQISNVCQDYGSLDAPHFMRTLKQAPHLLTISGTRRRYRAALTPQGVSRAQQLIATLRQPPTECFSLLILRPDVVRIDPDPFEAHGFRVSTAATFDEARSALNTTGVPDALLIRFHDTHTRVATSVSRFVRNRSDTPIIVATHPDHGRRLPARLRAQSDTQIDARIPTEEQARLLHNLVTTLGSLPACAQPDIVVDSRLRINLVERKASVNGNRIALSPLESRILHIFLRRKGETLSGDFIGQRLGFEMDSQSDRSKLTVYISRLRKKLTPDVSPRVNYIESQYGSGYRFVSPFTSPEQPGHSNS